MNHAFQHSLPLCFRRLSKYGLQLSKCDDVSCCKPLRAPLVRSVMGGRFLPAPMLFRHTPVGGLVRVEPQHEEKDAFFPPLEVLVSLSKDAHQIPRDTYCKSVNAETLKERRCPECSMDFATKAALRRHFVSMHPDRKSSRIKGGEMPPSLENVDVKNIVYRAGVTPMFMCEVGEGMFEWRYIPLDRPEAKAFIAKEGPPLAEDFPIADMRAWKEGFEVVA